MQRKGLTQKKLAEKIGVATGTIQQYELGKRQPRLEQIRKIATALDVYISDLLNEHWEDYAEQIKADFTKSSISLADFNKEGIEQAIADEQLLLDDYHKLNSDGRDEALKRVSELTELKKYTEIEIPIDQN